MTMTTEMMMMMTAAEEEEVMEIWEVSNGHPREHLQGRQHQIHRGDVAVMVEAEEAVTEEAIVEEQLTKTALITNGTPTKSTAFRHFQPWQLGQVGGVRLSGVHRRLREDRRRRQTCLSQPRNTKAGRRTFQ